MSDKEFADHNPCFDQLVLMAGFLAELKPVLRIVFQGAALHVLDRPVVKETFTVRK
jgi:hypothetical protein